MRKRLYLWIPVLFLMTFDVSLEAQRNPRSTAKLEKGGKFVMVEYGRPSLKGRDMFSQLQTGKNWRMGADKSTTLTTSGKLSFGKVSIPDGSYSLWLRKLDDKTYHLIFNKATGQWGTEYDLIQDLASVPLTLASASESVEQFTINLKDAEKGGQIELLWGTTILRAPFKLE